MSGGSAFCIGCGSRDCSGCLPPLDPPRHCSLCGGWLAVRVTPIGWRARCKVHGETAND